MQELGISSLGHIIEYGLSGKYESLFDLILKASDDCLKFAEDNDISVVELVLDPPEIFNSENQYSFIDIINSYSIKKQIHGPFIDVNLCSHNYDISKASIETYHNTAKICKKVKSKLMTIHPGLANFLIDSIREFNKIQLANAVRTLLELTNRMNITICIENMPKNCQIMTDENNIEEVFLKINRENIYLTYDTSHFYTCNGNVKELWEKFYNKVKNVHLVDNFSRKSDTHPPLGTGKVNFDEIFGIIKSYNYRGPLVIELSTTRELIQSIEFIHNFF
ncbi:MAG: sugar phosphate isomerase/epimerase family protein [Promethearchaeota archaeon]